MLANMSLQAASAIENLKMADSPAKKLNFDAADKENLPFEAETPVVSVEVSKPVIEEEKTETKHAVVAPTIRPEEADEPLLQANPQRFVLFPIKYHEVRVTSTTRHA
jgi:ribonucleoside-diphosphate reductase subunit M2